MPVKSRFAVIALLSALSIVALDVASAQKYNSGSNSIGSAGKYTPPSGGNTMRPPRGGGGYDGPRGGGGGGGGPNWVGPAIGMIPGIIANMPPANAMPPGRFIDDPNFVDDDDRPRSRRQQPRQTARQGARNPSGVPPVNERRLVPDEVVIELPNTTSPQTVDALQRRFRLERLESQTLALSGTTFYRWRIPDRRSVPNVIRALEASGAVASAQPNYLFRLQQSAPERAVPTEAKAVPGDAKSTGIPAAPIRTGDPAQYALAKLRLPEAHRLATGDNILVAVIDSRVDIDHPELKDAVAGTFDPGKTPLKPHMHGTAIAALIAGQGRLMGAAPAARILAAGAFDPAGDTAEATTFNIMKSLDWAAASNARIINMSFAGPADPAIQRSLLAASKKGIVLIAAAGNEGAKSPPLYPAAYPNVIAVSATDANDNLYKGSNRGRHIAVAAPGVDILVATPDSGYQVSTGTSYSAAEVSGIVALMLQRKPEMTPEAVAATLMATAKDLGPKGRDDQFGAGMIDAYRAVTEDAPAPRLSNATPR